MSDAETKTGPLAAYQHQIEAGLLQTDAAQLQAVQALQVLFEALNQRWQRPPSIWQQLALRLGLRKVEPLRGLYFWGGVGRGKTFLMDLFYRSVPGERKMRLHFNRFMNMIHARLAQKQGALSPLAEIAADLAGQVDLLCFDEFFVADIGDAMILANLLDGLFAQGVVLVATSNVPPDGLYENGLQRQKLLPAIALLKLHTQVMNVDSGTDYRLQSLNKAPMYYGPRTPENEAAMERLFQEVTRGMDLTGPGSLEIQQRMVSVRARAADIIWFDFNALCGQGRGSADYIELARQYHTVFISGVPVFNEARDDEARRFISLIDEFYDHGVKVVLSAATSLDRLYCARNLEFAFARTRSRLLEMQTREYLGLPHRPD